MYLLSVDYALRRIRVRVFLCVLHRICVFCSCVLECVSMSAYTTHETRHSLKHIHKHSAQIVSTAAAATALPHIRTRFARRQ